VKRAVIVHCWEGTPEYCWYPWARRELEKMGYEVKVPAFPDTQKPELVKWLPVLQEAIGTPDEDLVLIGHSVGCITILRYLESLKEDEKIGKAILVAPFTDHLNYDELKNFFSDPIVWELIKEHCGKFVCIHSDDDPYVALSHADKFKEKLDAEIIVKHEAGHMSGAIDGDKSTKELPEVIESVGK
jgi:uncharacterized protein